MNTLISKVLENSIAEEVGIEVGDRVLSINGNDINDIIDYKFLLAEEYIEVDIEKQDGEIWTFEIEKDYEEDLGVEFENSIMDEAKSCCNKCVFCFVDQLPKGLRNTLYFKDDDSRLSFLQGNFVTLTNMKDSDIDRIIRYRISPINVSVHTTNPELRAKMLNNRFAGNIYERLKKLAEADITMNCQIVCCPSINDGEELKKTIEDLYALYPAVQNVAIVPVGLTKFREGLFPLKLYDKDSAKKEIENIRVLQGKYIEEIGHPFSRLSDEFYVVAEEEIPEEDFYCDYEQLEDGIGMIRLFRENIKNNLKDLDKNKKGSFAIVTGVSAFNDIIKAAELIEAENNNIKVHVNKIINDFFGENITVAGLITATDIINQIDKHKEYESIIIPKNMLRSGEDIFLDDITLKDLSHRLNKKILVCDYTGENLIQIINENC